MEEKETEKQNLYKKFLNSRAFYPVTLSLIAALCVSIWAINASNKAALEKSASLPYSQANNIVTNVQDDRRTAATTTSVTKEQSTSYSFQENTPYKGDWIMPLNGKISKDYSDSALVKSKTMDDYRAHNGIDISAEKGAAVKAVNSGKVKSVYQDAFWGSVVLIDHGGGVNAKYCGLEKNSVPSEGALVSKGQKIGALAAIPCEEKDGYHLHFEVTVGNKVVDPLAAINKIETKE